MATPWSNSADRSTLDIQPGGPGNAFQVFDINGAIDSPSGGGRNRTTLWGRDERGGLAPRGIIQTSNPEDWKSNLTYPLSSENLLKRLNCPFTIRVRQYCGINRSAMTSYSAPGMIGYLGTTVTSFGYDSALAVGDGQAKDLMKKCAIAGALEQTWTPVAHDDISLTTQDTAFKRVLNIGAEICFGACGIAATEEDAWVAVTVKDASPAYGGGSAPWLYWTTDRWVTRNPVRIGALLGSDAYDVVLAGQRIIVFSDTKPPVYANLSDIYNGVVDPLLWASSSGLSSLSGSNFPKHAYAVDSSTIIGVCAAGTIVLSTDGGFSFSILYASGALTAQNLNAVDGFAGGNVMIGGNAGTFIRLAKTPGSSSFVGTLITVRDASLNTLSSNINSVRCPQGRGDEVYLGTAGGEIWRSRNVNATKPVFQNMKFDKTGTGSIADMDFVGYLGNTMFVLQSFTDGTSRVLRDFSGGNLGNDVEPVGDFVTPGNFGYNSISAANVNMAMVVGNVHGSYAYIGMIRPAQ